jgi:hypothetical protein
MVIGRIVAQYNFIRSSGLRNDAFQLLGQEALAIKCAKRH